MPEEKALIPFKEFLERVHPSLESNVSGLWKSPLASLVLSGQAPIELIRPDLRLHCERCEGERTFRCEAEKVLLRMESANTRVISYFCGDCREQEKSFSLSLIVNSHGSGIAFKYGEKPPFGVPVPNKLLRLFGDDRENFLKGRRCENQGLGVGAFAYYRRVVENRKNDIFEEIIRVCETVGAPRELVEELGGAKKEISFTKAMEQIKTALPEGLLIGGHNPLLALHNALSIHLHNESDAKCLESAHDIQLVLTDLIETRLEHLISANY